jgi:hypothetical protein
MKNVLQKISIVSIGMLVPGIAFAQVVGLSKLLKDIQYLISLTVPVLISLGVLAFMWGIVLYLFKGDKAEGRMFMVWGIIALFVMTSVWGLVGILRGTLFGNTNPNNAQNVSLPPQGR